MNSAGHIGRSAFAVLLAVTTTLAFGTSRAPAQDSGGEKHKREYIEAVVQGMNAQQGRMGSIMFTIEELSTDEERQALIGAFQKAGSQGLCNAISKMKSKGRVTLPGMIGYDINYVKEFATPTGRLIRIVTDRPVRIGETWASTRSKDYNLCVAEINLPSDGKGTGTLIPAAQFKLDKNEELTVEAFQNPWKLLNVQIRD